MALRISTSHHWAAEDSRGAVIEPIYTKWCPVVFVIPENQLKSISALNTQAIVFFSCFSGLLSTAVAIYISAGFAEKITPVGEMLTKYGAPFSAILSVVFFVLGIHAICTKGSVLKGIKDESKELKMDRSGDVSIMSKISKS